VEPRGISDGVGACRPAVCEPLITSKSTRATSAPKWCTSWLIADIAGWVIWHSWESSQASSDRSSGTVNPISAATPAPATAMMSLS
jgi:hypothetical protein